MNTKLKLTTIGLLVVLLAACGAGQPAATQEPTEEITLPPAEQATHAPVEGVTVSVSQISNCRSGPGTNFDLVYAIGIGEVLDVLGTDEDGEYWVVDSPQGECWLWGENALTSGDTSGLTAYASPPTPTPVPPPDWNGTWHIWMWMDPGGVTTTDFNVNITQTGSTFFMTFKIYTTTLKFNGTVSADGMQVTGNIVSDTALTLPFNFHRNPDDLRQFSGMWRFAAVPGMDLDFCGSKGGAPKPDPCRLH